ncbi:MAG: RNA polymerase sigma factor SigM [Propionicimonas sp.]|uniref:RNA polymerase sigma factor SigM n=1 Tax=Propionicimonas sp. TaxID=1955623 RepID=UPI002B1F0CBD|nr:RNA polymerase sigma factor SigM [Propionicimonas sp.]MEA4945418.1 RNA polymerase sigma factor SigM [Propionicimonas sp.]
MASMITDLDDKALLAAHVAGDPRAFTELFRRHADRLWTLALRTLRNPEEAEEAVQEAMISAFRRAGDFRGDAAVGTWLHRIVINACFDRLRRAKARPSLPLEDEVLAGLPSASPGPEETTVQAEVALEVEQALAGLPVDQRAALVLVDMQGYSTDEAATILGCAPGTVKSRCSRGRAKLAPRLRHLLEA